MFSKIKQKIKLAKIWWIIIAALFILMIVSNIYLNCKVVYLEKEIEKLK